MDDLKALSEAAQNGGETQWDALSKALDEMWAAGELILLSDHTTTIEAAVKAEREACANLASDLAGVGYRDIAKAIRARGGEV